ncbi:hypothetical protein AK812_SmicGene34646 [Symbiodinium microadriaticum]|uniref:C2H2-type domain-containing protein n=1 Tax=Symbiodinium microadriaticum TaxID=2951 RepID=A0A1Q9CNH9_SYMMI|nr:hypothetical protein AK812_SmicGene34646 [Symbiodinium microadriaticum]
MCVELCSLLALAQVIAQLDTFAPMFWSLAICVDTGPPVFAGQVTVAAAQVFTAVYVRDHDEVPNDAYAARGDSEQGDDDTGWGNDSHGDPPGNPGYPEVVLLQWVLSCAASAAPSTPMTTGDASLRNPGPDKWGTVYDDDTHVDVHCLHLSELTGLFIASQSDPRSLNKLLPAIPGVPSTLLAHCLTHCKSTFSPSQSSPHSSLGKESGEDRVATTGPGPPRGPEARVIVSLADCLLVSPFQRDCLDLQSIFQQLDPQGSDWLDSDLEPILHDNQAIHVYTDGSAASSEDDLRPCSWALTVWLDAIQGRMLLGQASATSAVPGSPYYLGEVEDTALVGEQLALAWGFAWVIEHASPFSLPVTFHYDAQGAGRGAFGQWTPPFRRVDPHPGFPCLSDLLVHLRQLASQFAALEHAYVAGHSGQIENELADQLAKQSRRKPCEYWERVAPTWLSQLAQHKLLPWAWMLHSGAPDLPPLFTIESEAKRMQAADTRPQQAPAPGVVATEHPACLAELCFTAVSYNALTMRDPKGPGQANADKAGLRIVGRKALLKNQLAEIQPLFVGLQETRVPDSNLQPDADYIIFQSASTPQGSLGVALWISKTTPYGHAKGTAQFILPKHCSVFGTSPRHIALDIEAPHLRLAVVALHAPTLATATLQEVKDFWRARAAEIEKRPSGADFLLLCDANSRVGSVCTPQVGEHDKEDENEAGTAFRNFLEQIEGYLPSTFGCHHVGTSATWVSPFDTYHRIDYIVTPIAWSGFRLTSWVLEDFESLQKKDDHWPVALSCAFARHIRETKFISVWRQHFATQEAGELVTSEQYVSDFSRYSKPARVAVFDLEVLPTLAEVERLILGLKRGRAPGPDSVTTETLQVQPVLTARQLLPVLLKSSMGLREPLTFRGGDLVCLAKRAGATLRCQDYRSILVSSIPGKIHHRKLRSQLTKLLEGYRQPLQSGALPGEGIEVIAIAAKTFQLLCDGIRRPWGLVFFDLQSAYYQIIREALVPGCEDDTALLALFDKLQLPPKALIELKQHLQQLALLPAFSASEHLTALINDLFRGSWFRISGSALLTVTKRGTRPGDPAADVLFSLSLSALLKSVAGDLSSGGLLPDLPRPSHRHDWAGQGHDEDIGSPAWADDFLQPQTGKDSCDLLDRIQRSVQLVTEKSTSMGMNVSFGREKTAVMVPNWIALDFSDVVRYSVDSKPYIHVLNSLTGALHQLLVVQSYKHLGGILVATSSPLPDVYHRAARATAVVKPLQKRLFSDPSVQLAVRRTLLRSLAMSKFVHTSASLFLHAACHNRVWAQQFVALWRSLFRRRSKTRTEHSYSVLRAACAPAPPLALALTRAVFLSKLTRSGPQLLARLLFDHWATHPANSWLAQLKDDVFQVCLYLPHLGSLFSVGREIFTVLDSLCDDPSWWPGQVKKAVKVFGKDLEVWHERRQRGQAVEASPPDVEKPYQCGFCSARFVLRKHLCVHLSRTHAVLAPARHFAPLPFCLACHRHYGLVSRVQQHLKNSDQCMRRLVHLIDPLTPSEIREAEAPEVLARKRQKAGAWKDFAVPTARPIVFWPRAPVWDERCPPAQAPEEQVLISELIPSFRPKTDNVAWIEAWLQRGTAHAARGRLKEALLDFQEALLGCSSDQERSNVLFSRGSAHSDAGDEIRALADFSEDLERDRLILDSRPANTLEPPPHLWTGSLCSSAALLPIVLHPGKSLRISGADLRDHFYFFAVSQERLERNLKKGGLAKEEARQLFGDEAAEHADRRGQVHVGLGTLALGDSSVCEFARGFHLCVLKRHGALSSEVLELEPGRLEAWLSRGTTFLCQDNCDAASADAEAMLDGCKRALELDPELTWVETCLEASLAEMEEHEDD